VTDTLQMYSRNKLFSVALSREMAPSARIIAYFVAPDGQMVADSHNFHVNGSGLHEVGVMLPLLDMHDSFNNIFFDQVNLFCFEAKYFFPSHENIVFDSFHFEVLKIILQHLFDLYSHLQQLVLYRWRLS